MILTVIFAPLIAFLSVMFSSRWLGKIGAAFLTCFSLVISFVVSLWFFFEHLVLGANTLVTLNPWILSGVFYINWEFYFDPLSLTMLSMISLVSGLVHFYSIEYMEFDPHFNRFMSFLSLFTFFMFILVTSANYVQLFVGWEGVGLCSYLLVNFWYTRINANYAAMKAVIVNRVGDFGVTVAIVLIYFTFLTTDFVVLPLLVDCFFLQTINIFYCEIPVFVMYCIFFIIRYNR